MKKKIDKKENRNNNENLQNYLMRINQSFPSSKLVA